ncbi:hypothetical protein B296_00005905 [Ensete ventricosum]|uniref:Uncharacterized protein n=1 Tax=Ensete ventricosum TaxID=4639 RepID=A0A426YEC9_ENSVE|nr:hypothetical protein B296_00005905 [Ensete ventricosum]
MRLPRGPDSRCILLLQSNVSSSDWIVMCCDPVIPRNHQLNLGLLINLSVGLVRIYSQKGVGSRLRFRVDKMQFRLLLVLRFEGAVEAVKDFYGSGLRLGRKV